MTLNSLTSVKQPKVLSHARKSMEQIDERREEKKTVIHSGTRNLCGKTTAINLQFQQMI